MIRSAYSASELDLVAKGIARQMRCPSPLGEYIASSADEDDGPAFFSDLAGWRENDEVREFLRTAPRRSPSRPLLMRLDSPTRRATRASPGQGRGRLRRHPGTRTSRITPWTALSCVRCGFQSILYRFPPPFDSSAGRTDDVWYVPRTFANTNRIELSTTASSVVVTVKAAVGVAAISTARFCTVGGRDSLFIFFFHTRMLLLPTRIP